ncbi:MAG: hypothetical protein R6W73_08740 [Candidatus Saliniplasma sp.]
MRRSRNEEEMLLFKEPHDSFKWRKRSKLKQSLIYGSGLIFLNLSFTYFHISGIGNFSYFTIAIWILANFLFGFPVFLFYLKYKNRKRYKIYESYIHIPDKSLTIPFSDIKEVIGSKSLLKDYISVIIKTKSANNHVLGTSRRPNSRKIMKLFRERGIKAEIRSYKERLKKERPFKSD